VLCVVATAARVSRQSSITLDLAKPRPVVVQYPERGRRKRKYLGSKLFGHRQARYGHGTSPTGNFRRLTNCVLDGASIYGLELTRSSALCTHKNKQFPFLSHLPPRPTKIRVELFIGLRSGATGRAPLLGGPYHCFLHHREMLSYLDV
jgi:hypothetical protein